MGGIPKALCECHHSKWQHEPGNAGEGGDCNVHGCFCAKYHYARKPTVYVKCEKHGKQAVNRVTGRCPKCPTEVWPRDFWVMLFDEHGKPHHEKKCPTQTPRKKVINWFMRGLKEAAFWMDGDILYVNKTTFKNWFEQNWKDLPR